MTDSNDIRVDYDSQWKAIITTLFEDFIAFFLPEANDLIDFGKPVEFLEQELFSIIDDKYKEGKVINDKLVKVNLKSGEEKWILVHIEIQSSYEKGFGERMFTYFYRIYDRYGQKITAIAIYTGEKTPEKYDRYEYAFLGTKNLYQFNTYKIAEASKAKLLGSSNPFALAVLASQYLLQTKDDHRKRLGFKLKLIRLAKEQNYSDDQIVNILKFIALILVLPDELELKFDEELLHTYVIDMEITRTKSQERLANKIHVALYGETVEDKVKRERMLDHTFLIQKLLKMNKLSVEEIAEAVGEPVDFVEEIKARMAN